MPQAGIDPQRQSHATYERSALPPGFQSRSLYNQALTQVAYMETKRANIFWYSEVQFSNPISAL